MRKLLLAALGKRSSFAKQASMMASMRDIFPATAAINSGLQHCRPVFSAQASVPSYCGIHIGCITQGFIAFFVAAISAGCAAALDCNFLVSPHFCLLDV